MKYRVVEIFSIAALVAASLVVVHTQNSNIALSPTATASSREFLRHRRHRVVWLVGARGNPRERFGRFVQHHIRVRRNQERDRDTRWDQRDLSGCGDRAAADHADTSPNDATNDANHTDG